MNPVPQARRPRRGSNSIGEPGLFAYQHQVLLQLWKCRKQVLESFYKTAIVLARLEISHTQDERERKTVVGGGPTPGRLSRHRMKRPRHRVRRNQDLVWIETIRLHYTFLRELARGEYANGIPDLALHRTS